MTKTLIIGASGKIGKMVTRRMLEHGENVVALVRDKNKLSDLDQSKLELYEADLEEDFSMGFKNCDQVIFSAGSGASTGADKTILIDQWAACRAADYAKQYKVEHFVMVSSIGADHPEQGSDKMKPYLVAKHMADEHLMHSGLDYTILRPGTLLDEDAKGGFASERPTKRENFTITREDVADALVYAVGKNNLKGQVIELFNGNKPVDSVLG